MFRMVRHPIVCTGMVLVMGAALAGCGPQTQAQTQAKSKQFAKRTIPVEVESVKMSTISQGNMYTGSITPVAISNISSKVSGKVTSLSVNVGDHVHTGQPLASIDTSALKQQLEQTQSTVSTSQAQLKKAQSDHDASAAAAEKALEVSKTQYDKAQSDYNTALTNAQNAVALAQQNLDNAQNNPPKTQGQGASIAQLQGSLQQAQAQLAAAQNSQVVQVAQKQYEQAQQAYQSALSTSGISVSQAQLQQAQTSVQVINEQIQDGTLTSPVDGIVTAINTPAGQMSGGQASILTIASPDMEATVNVPESNIGKISNGANMTITIPTLGKTFTGTVKDVHPTLDPTTKSYGVDISVSDPNHQLLPGMFAEASLSSDGKQGLTVPADAVLNDVGGNSVFVVQNGKAKKVSIQLGDMTSTQYEVTQGLQKDDQVVIQGQDLLSNGVRVQIVQPGQELNAGNTAKQYSGHSSTKSGGGQ